MRRRIFPPPSAHSLTSPQARPCWLSLGGKLASTSNREPVRLHSASPLPPAGAWDRSATGRRTRTHDGPRTSTSQEGVTYDPFRTTFSLFNRISACVASQHSASPGPVGKPCGRRLYQGTLKRTNRRTRKTSRREPVAHLRRIGHR